MSKRDKLLKKTFLNLMYLWILVHYSLLEMMVEPNSDIKDPSTLFKNIAANPVGYTLAFDFLINRWDDVQAA